MAAIRLLPASLDATVYLARVSISIGRLKIQSLGNKCLTAVCVCALTQCTRLQWHRHCGQLWVCLHYLSITERSTERVQSVYARAATPHWWPTFTAPFVVHASKSAMFAKTFAGCVLSVAENICAQCDAECALDLWR